MSDVQPVRAADPDRLERAKCRQVLDGARQVFLSQGFDAASMGEIARRPGVSKGTLYVYFDSKERLFEAIAHEECGAQAETVFSLDPADHDVEAVFTRLGCSFVKFLCRPGAMSPLRTVISSPPPREVAAAQFLDSCVATILKPLLFNACEAPSDERI